MNIETPTEPERWAAHPDHPTYDVSTHGRVRSWKKGRRKSVPTEPRYLKLRASGTGYLTVSLDGVTTNVHSAVLRTHVGPRPEGWVSRHMNGDKTDNRLENLCWGTYSENALDMHGHGTMKLGEERHNAKLSDAQVIEARLLRAIGVKVAPLAQRYGVSPDVMAKALRGDTWKHLPGAVPSNRKRRHLEVVR